MDSSAKKGQNDQLSYGIHNSSHDIIEWIRNRNVICMDIKKAFFSVQEQLVYDVLCYYYNESYA